ncbi:unnamed protein product, partial [Vitis vinifera]
MVCCNTESFTSSWTLPLLRASTALLLIVLSSISHSWRSSRSLPLGFPSSK